MTTLTAAALQQIVNRELPDDTIEVALETRFEDAGLDSLSVLELGSALEKELKIVLLDDDLHNCETFGDLVALVGSRERAA
ncbi:acyl carrier protein [Rhodococcus sp. 27YEA15]|uniref:acyl carrier protein n=1 Tax=Rhodococcus sp. 27YEA15 TaxID=3156259 RepID=UPI003C7CB1C5